MKTLKIIPGIAISLVLMLLSSCIEYYKITTKINADGSLERTIQVVSDDSTSTFNGSLKVPTDSSWQISTRWFYEVPEDTNSEKKYEYTAKRTFASASELNTFLKPDNDTTGLVTSVTNFKKKFRWFYTYICFSETHKMKMPLKHVSIDAYLTEAEYRLFYDDNFTYDKQEDSLVHIKDLEQMPVLSQKDSTRMEELEDKINLKLTDWIGRNIFEEYLLLLANGQLITEDGQKRLNSGKEELYLKTNLKHLDMFEGDNESYRDTIHAFFGIDSLEAKHALKDSIKKFEHIIERSADLLMDNNKIKNSMELPGLLLNTNADSISGNVCFWNYNDTRNNAKDYTFFAESRIMNRWAIIVSGVIVLLLVVQLIRGSIR